MQPRGDTARSQLTDTTRPLIDSSRHGVLDTRPPQREHDPYLLPMPGPHSPVVGPDLVKPIHAHLNSRYRDPIWSLAPLTENPSAEKTKIHWRNFPVVFHAELRLAVWNLINGVLRPTFLRSRGSSMRTRIGVTTIATTVQHWLYLTKFGQPRHRDPFRLRYLYVR